MTTNETLEITIVESSKLIKAWFLHVLLLMGLSLLNACRQDTAARYDRTTSLIIREAFRATTAKNYGLAVNKLTNERIF